MAPALAQSAAIARDTARIIEWKAAEGALKSELEERLLREKEGLVRQLTAKAARKENTTADREDLLQAGRHGFMLALQGFDPERGFAISTYAWWKIRKEVQAVAREAMPVKLPRIRLTNDERGRAVMALRANPDVAPESIGIHKNQLQQVRDSIGIRYISEDTPRGTRALHRRSLNRNEQLDAEAALDDARMRNYAALIVRRARDGSSADDLRLSGEQYAAVLEFIQNEDKEESDMESVMMQGSNGAIELSALHAEHMAGESIVGLQAKHGIGRLRIADAFKKHGLDVRGKNSTLKASDSPKAAKPKQARRSKPKTIAATVDADARLQAQLASALLEVQALQAILGLPREVRALVTSMPDSVFARVRELTKAA